MQLRSQQTRALDAMLNAVKGTIYFPTGGGKSLVIFRDIIRRALTAQEGITVVVVAPRILLATQLCDEFVEENNNQVNFHYLHVHTGETKYTRTTNSNLIQLFNNTARTAGESCIIFTTYHSLHRVIESGIDVDVTYFDEAHNSVTRNFFTSTAIMSEVSDKSFYFTATPKYHKNPYANGMNNRMVYGDNLITVSATELIDNGSILPAEISAFEVDSRRLRDTAAETDRDTLLNVIDNLSEDSASKVLVAAPNTKVLWNMLSGSDIIDQLRDRGYEILHITSKHGAYINKKKVNREVFFETLTTYGKDDAKKFILFHYSILSEGINVPGLTHCILLRNLNVIEMAQTIGRVIRLNREDSADIISGKIPAGAVGLYRKSAGHITVPVYQNSGKDTITRLKNVCRTIFVDGNPVHSYAR